MTTAAGRRYNCVGMANAFAKRHEFTRAARRCAPNNQTLYRGERVAAHRGRVRGRIPNGNLVPPSFIWK